MSKIFPNDLVPLGKIIKPHGIKGDLKVFLYNQESDTFIKGLKIWLKSNDEYSSYKLYSIRGSNKNIIMKFETLHDINQIQNFIKKEIYVSRSDFAEIKENHSYYLNDLIGLQVFDDNNNCFGEIIDVLNIPANDVMIIEHENKEVMVPVVDHYIKLFDFENKLIIMKNIKDFF